MENPPQRGASRPASPGLTWPARANQAMVSDRVSVPGRKTRPQVRSIRVDSAGVHCVAIDMESATVAAQGYRFRVPYGTLLCVSDKPLHGEIKLPGQANAFYERAISQHLRIGIETLRILKHEGAALHSRKLRAFDEPPFR